MTDSMTSIQFVEMIDKFLKHPIFVEQEALIVTALYEGKINKQTAGELLVKVAKHNCDKINELFKMDADEIMKLAEGIDDGTL